MALTVNVIPRYKGLSGSHPQLQDGHITDDGTTVSLSLPIKTAGSSATFTVQTTTYVVAAGIDVVVCNAPATTFTVTLPVATASGRVITVKNVNQGTVEVTPDGADTIDGVNSAAILGKYESVRLLDYAANAWAILY